MAKKSVTKEVSIGTCHFCKGEFDKARMTQHLKHCKQRVASLKAESSAEAEKTKLFHLVVEGRDLPMYWMHLEMPVSATLDELDDFLRDTWLECCGHLSEFKIGKISYSSQMEDEEMFWEFGDEEEGDEDESDEEQDEDEDESDLALSQIESEFADLPVSEVATKLIELLSTELQANLADLPPDEAEAKIAELLATRLQAEVGAPVSPEMQAQIAMMTRFLHPDLLSELASGAFDERDMDVELSKVLKVGLKFYHEYDFGSTTELTLRVVGEREGVEAEDEDGDPLAVLVMARNEPPVIVCNVCGQPATKIAPGYFYAADAAYCDACAKKNDEYEDEEMLPVVNSPRTGVCGYTGDYEMGWEEIEDEDEDEEEE